MAHTSTNPQLFFLDELLHHGAPPRSLVQTRHRKTAAKTPRDWLNSATRQAPKGALPSCLTCAPFPRDVRAPFPCAVLSPRTPRKPTVRRCRAPNHCATAQKWLLDDDSTAAVFQAKVATG